jgi:hypothetical protein
MLQEMAILVVRSCHCNLISDFEIDYLDRIVVLDIQTAIDCMMDMKSMVVVMVRILQLSLAKNYSNVVVVVVLDKHG